MLSTNKKGFTLLELLITIGILGILSSATIFIINPTEIFKKSRDAQRISDLNNLKTAIDLYLDNDVNPYLGETNQTYSHIQGVKSGDRGVSTQTGLAVNGSGWIPINFQDASTWISPSSLPIDPNPTNADSENARYYTYLVDNNYKYVLVANMESQYYSQGGDGDKESTDGGIYDSLYEIGSNLNLLETNELCYSGNIPIPTTTTTLPPFLCGTQTVTFAYNGSTVTYGTVLSPTGKCWLDRNLGASRVAIAYNDDQAYGDVFQWGRLDDGHQIKTSATTSTVSTTDIPGHSYFILNSSSPYDWRNPPNNNLWQGVNGTNNPCPQGWRVPTQQEWDNERLTWSPNDRVGAFNGVLKLTAGGGRLINGSFYKVGSYGRYWASSIWGGSAYNMQCDESNGCSMVGILRVASCSIRCIKD